MPRYKTTERQEAYRLYVECGVEEQDELARRAKLSITSIKKWWKEMGAAAQKDRRERLALARKLYVEQGISDIKALCAQARIDPALWALVYEPAWDADRAEFVAQHPALYTTGQILQQAAENLLTLIKKDGYKGERVTELISLCNALEKFKTGEFDLEMILVGMTHFVQYVEDNAKDQGLKPRDIKALGKVMDAFRKHIVKKLGGRA